MAKPPKPPWPERFERIKAQYPSVVSTNWADVMADQPDIFARFMGDILKVENRGPKPGKRPKLSRREGLERLRKLAGEDYSELPFTETFKALTQNHSVRGVASRTGLAPTHVHRLLQGSTQPSFETIEKIAEGYSKHPSFFLEYRIAKVIIIVDDLLQSSPDTATSWYRKLYAKEIP